MQDGLRTAAEILLEPIEDLAGGNRFCAEIDPKVAIGAKKADGVLLELGEDVRGGVDLGGKSGTTGAGADNGEVNTRFAKGFADGMVFDAGESAAAAGDQEIAGIKVSCPAHRVEEAVFLLRVIAGEAPQDEGIVDIDPVGKLGLTAGQAAGIESGEVFDVALQGREIGLEGGIADPAGGCDVLAKGVGESIQRVGE